MYICPVQHWRQAKKLFIISLKLKFNGSPAFYLATQVLGQKKKKKGEKFYGFKGEFRKQDVAQWQAGKGGQERERKRPALQGAV